MEEVQEVEEQGEKVGNCVPKLTCYRRYVDKIGSNTILLLSSIPYHWIGTMGRCQVIRLL